MTRSAASEPRTFRHALVLMTMTSLLVPVAGIITSPILSHGLGVAGRGEAAAAVAPNSLLASVATLGLPEALTYYLAKYPQISRTAVLRATILGLLCGVACFLVVLAALPFLSAGDVALGDLILIATALAVPQLVVNLLRGAASGRQMWRAVATERLSNSLLRVIGLIVLLLTGQLTVLTAVLVGSLGPLVAGLAYWRLFTDASEEPGEPFPGRIGHTLLAFGSRVWVGAVASMLLARIGQLLFAPLSTFAELGLYTVAVTISDVPLIVALAVRDALYGVNSRFADAEQVTATSRITLLLGTLGCLVLGGTLPLWIDLVFGAGFSGAVTPTWILMLGAIINIPGFLAAAGLGAWGRPGLRSIGLALTLAINIPLFVVLVPESGAVGAALAALVSSLASTVFMVVAASQVMRTPVRFFLLPRRSDITRLWVGGTGMLRRGTSSRLMKSAGRPKRRLR